MLVKICGITDVDDALAAVEAGADWIGLNFLGGPRRIDPGQAGRILQCLDDAGCVVGLVWLEQGQPEPATASMLRDNGVRRLQLYGDVTPEAVGRLVTEGFESILVQRAADDTALSSLNAFLAACGQARPSHVLFDAGETLSAANHGEQYQLGGTGRLADWSAIAAARDAGRFADWPPVLLAGGLTSENVAEAISAVRPAGVDVCSGVESRPGRKDRAKLEALVAAARGQA